jgi:hypothetical protein
MGNLTGTFPHRLSLLETGQVVHLQQLTAGPKNPSSRATSKSFCGSNSETFHPYPNNLEHIFQNIFLKSYFRFLTGDFNR